MKKISAEIIADSISPQGHRITSMLLTYPRFIHSELMTHRMFSRNSASSRAIPFEKMIKMVEEDPFIPIAWQKLHVGMQGNDYIQTDDGLYVVNRYWLEARDKAIKAAKDLHSCNITKQLCNRILEPFMWHTTLVTATEWENFFELRCPQYGNDEHGYFKSKKDALRHLQGKGVNITNLLKSTDIEWQKINKSQAEIHIQALAESMWDAMNESTPKQLLSGQWHLPFGDNISDGLLAQIASPNKALIYSDTNLTELRIKISVARAARLSYNNFDGEIDYKKDIQLHDKLLKDRHLSCFEHCARAMSDDEYYGHHLSQGNGNPFDTNGKDIFGVCNNFRGWIQYRHLVEYE